MPTTVCPPARALFRRLQIEADPDCDLAKMMAAKRRRAPARMHTRGRAASNALSTPRAGRLAAPPLPAAAHMSCGEVHLAVPPKQIAIHCGIHSGIGSSFATGLASG